MTDSTDNPMGGAGQVPEPGREQGSFSEQVRYEPVGARLPEKVAPGVFCTGAIVIEGPSEFVLDFIQGMSRPPRVAARVIVNHQVMGQFVAALQDNLRKYEQNFGPPKALPKPQPQNRPSIQEMYDQIKMADEQLSGAYATTVMIGHSPSEFMLDFITRFFPHAAVAARVYLAASNVPRVLETMSSSYQQYMRRVQLFHQQQNPPPVPPPEAPAGPAPEGPASPPAPGTEPNPQP